MISGQGRSNSQIMLVGDFATREDCRHGYALSGLQEGTLRTLFKDNNFNLDYCYRTTLIKEELSYYGKAKKKLKEAIKEAEKTISPNNFESILQNEIEVLLPNIVVPLGELGLSTLTGKKGITKFRGSVIPLRGDWQAKITSKTIRVIPTLGPYYIYEDWSHKPTVSLDIQKIVKNKDREDPIKEEGLIWVCKTSEAFQNFVRRHYEKSSYLAFDIETYLGIPTCISFCFDGSESISIPLFTTDINYADAILLTSGVAKLLASSIPKIGQNVKYDWTILERFGYRINNIMADTMLASHTIYPELPKGLDFLTSVYTDMPYYKDEGKEYNPKLHTRDRLYLYNAKDSLATHKVFTKQLGEMEELNLTEFYNKRVMPLFFLYKEIDDTGIRIDWDRRKELISTYEMLLLEKEIRLKEVAKDVKFNPGSSKQIGQLVYKRLKFPKRTKTSDLGKQSYNTEAEMLEELWVFHAKDNIWGLEGGEILKDIVAYRKITKVLQYLNIYIHPDGRLRTSYKIHGTESGRTSGGKTIDQVIDLDKNGKLITTRNGKLPYYGASLQTFPKHGFPVGGVSYGKDLRSIFIPSRGHVFIEGDGSQAEARIVAVLSEDYDLLYQFDVFPGVHRLTASWIFNLKAEEINKDSREYFLGKKSRHAGHYDQKAKGLALQVHEPLSTCEKMLRVFHDHSPKIRGVFHNEIRDFIRKNGFLITPHGRRRDFFGRFNENLYREAFADIPQGTISDHTKFAMTRIKRRLPWVRFLYEGHDSCMAEIPFTRKDEYCEVLKEEMERIIDFRTCSLPRNIDLVIPVEITWSDTNWQNMYAIK